MKRTLLTLLALPLAAQEGHRITLRVSQADTMGREIYTSSSTQPTPGTAVYTTSQLAPEPVSLPTLTYARSFTWGDFVVDLTHGRQNATVMAPYDPNAGGTPRFHLRAEDTALALGWQVPLAQVGASSLAARAGFRYEHHHQESTYQSISPTGQIQDFYGPARSTMRSYGPTVGLYHRAPFGGRWALATELQFAFLRGQRKVDTYPSGNTLTLGYTSRQASTDTSGAIHLSYAFSNRFEGSVGYDHRALNGTTFIGPTLGATYRF